MFYLLFYSILCENAYAVLNFFLLFFIIAAAPPTTTIITVYLPRYSIAPQLSSFLPCSFFPTIHISNVNAAHRIASKSLCNVHIIFETVISLWFKAVKLRKYLKRNKEKNQEHKYWMCHTNDCLTLSERVSEWVSEWVNECENECERECTIKNSKEK